MKGLDLARGKRRWPGTDCPKDGTGSEFQTLPLVVLLLYSKDTARSEASFHGSLTPEILISLFDIPSQ